MLVHARALLTSSPEGVTDYVDADMHDAGTILTAAAKTLDLTRPVALLFMGVLGHFRDIAETRAIVRGLLDPLPSGSYLATCDGTDGGEAAKEALDGYADTGAVPYVTRPPEQIAGFFERAGTGGARLRLGHTLAAPSARGRRRRPDRQRCPRRDRRVRRSRTQALKAPRSAARAAAQLRQPRASAACCPPSNGCQPRR